MKTWLLSIIGVVILIAIAEMLLPSGKLKKSIRGVFGLIVMLVIMKPLPGLRNAEWSFDFDLQQNISFLNDINARKVSAMETDGENYLESLGEKNCEITLYGNWKDGSFVLESVQIISAHAISSVNKNALAEYYRIGAEKVVMNFVG